MSLLQKMIAITSSFGAAPLTRDFCAPLDPLASKAAVLEALGLSDESASDDRIRACVDRVLKLAAKVAP